jgi:hypothetical protein
MIISFRQFFVQKFFFKTALHNGSVPLHRVPETQNTFMRFARCLQKKQFCYASSCAAREDEAGGAVINHTG